jgi:single-strand DNA-binding protein
MYQQVIIVGNVGRDPELRYTQNGVAVCDFSVAVNKVTNVNGERREKTTWFRVTCWRQLAETVNQYLTRGRQVMVVGEVEASAYLDKSGQPASSLDLTARDVRFLGGREGGEAGGGGYDNHREYNEDFAPPNQIDDIPF